MLFYTLLQLRERMATDIRAEEIIRAAAVNLSRFPLIAQFAVRGRPVDRISDAVNQSWPERPPELAFLLWVASRSELLESTHANQILTRIEGLLHHAVVSRPGLGAWQSRAAKLMQLGSPDQRVRYSRHVGFRSALFELQLACRLGRSGYVAGLVSDKKCSPDVIVRNARGRDICSVEAYAPQKSTARDLAEQEAVWREVVEGAAYKQGIGRISTVSVSPTALPAALRELVSDPNFERKLRQLEGGVVPTVLAVLPWSLGRHGVTHLLPHLLGADRGEFGAEMFAGLPERCLGYLVCFFDLLNEAVGLELLVAAGRTLPADVEELFDKVGAVTVRLGARSTPVWV